MPQMLQQWLYQPRQQIRRQQCPQLWQVQHPGWKHSPSSVHVKAWGSDFLCVCVSLHDRARLVLSSTLQRSLHVGLFSGCAGTSVIGHIHPCSVAITHSHHITPPWQCDFSSRCCRCCQHLPLSPLPSLLSSPQHCGHQHQKRCAATATAHSTLHDDLPAQMPALLLKWHSLVIMTCKGTPHVHVASTPSLKTLGKSWNLPTLPSSPAGSKLWCIATG